MGLGTGGPLWENSARFRNGTLFVGLLRVPFFVAPRDLQARLQRGGEAECWTGGGGSSAHAEMGRDPTHALGLRGGSSPSPRPFMSSLWDSL